MRMWEYPHIQPFPGVVSLVILVTVVSLSYLPRAWA